MNFIDALKVADAAMKSYAESHPNWWKRLDGTPIPNDLGCHIANAIVDSAPQEAGKPEVGGMNEYDLLEEWTDAAGICFDGVDDYNTTGPIRRMDILQLIRVARDLKLPTASKEAGKPEAPALLDETPLRSMTVSDVIRIVCANSSLQDIHMALLANADPSQPEPTSKGKADFATWLLAELKSDPHALITSENLGDWIAAFKGEFSSQQREPQEAAEVTEFNVGRYCLSEDDCIAEGLHFGAYERGVEDAAKAFGRNRRG